MFRYDCIVVMPLQIWMHSPLININTLVSSLFSFYLLCLDLRADKGKNLFILIFRSVFNERDSKNALTMHATFRGLKRSTSKLEEEAVDLAI